MLSLKNRLKLDSDFKRVKEKGTLVQSENFALAIHDRGDAEDTRFGFVVSTKISKSAVARNGIKRALRSGIVNIIDRVKRGVDVVFLVKPIILKKKKEELLVEVERAMKSAKLLD